MKLLRGTAASVLAASVIGASLFVSPAHAQNNAPGGCTQTTSGGNTQSVNRSGRQNSAAVLPSVIGVAVQNVAVPVTATALNGLSLQAVCLNDTLNQNDVRVLQDILNESPILSENSNNLNNLLQGSDIAVANGVQVIAVDLGSGDVFLLRQ